MPDTTPEQNYSTLLEAMIDSTIEGIIVFDENKTAVMVNKAACDIFRYSKEEIIGKKAFEFVSQKSLNSVKSKIVKQFQPAYEAVMQRKGKEEFPALLKGQDIFVDGRNLRISSIIDISDIKNKEKELYKTAYFDKLTALPNRQKLVHDMKKNTQYACVIFNINNFGEINDLFGYKIGDQVLNDFAQLLKKDFINLYRTNADEFAVLYNEEISVSDLEKMVVEMINKVEKKEFYAHEEPFHITIRAGISINTNKLLSNADIAVRESKIKKRSYVIYNEKESLEKRYKHNLKTSFWIRKALKTDGIVCYYQPIIDNKTGKTVKYETLVRMKNGDKIILPNDFLHIAKTTKLYPQITKTVLEHACEKFKNSDKKFSVNLSIEDIENKELTDFIIDYIQKEGVAERIIFEILETEGINNYDEVETFIKKLKALDSEFSIDDFGSGYSNFKHILSLNIDYLKIDGSLIKDININKKNRVIVETIIDFARKIGVKTVAEFVSQKDIFDTVRLLGIDYSQGFYLGRPSEKLI